MILSTLNFGPPLCEVAQKLNWKIYHSHHVQIHYCQILCRSQGIVWHGRKLRFSALSQPASSGGHHPSHLQSSDHSVSTIMETSSSWNGGFRRSRRRQHRLHGLRVEKEKTKDEEAQVEKEKKKPEGIEEEIGQVIDGKFLLFWLTADFVRCLEVVAGRWAWLAIQRYRGIRSSGLCIYH